RRRWRRGPLAGTLRDGQRPPQRAGDDGTRCGRRVDDVAVDLGIAPGPAGNLGAGRVSLADWAGMAATSFVAAVLQAANGFGFAVLAVPLFPLFTDPGPAVQLVMIVTLALSAVVLPG